jgi:hypothetical protein
MTNSNAVTWRLLGRLLWSRGEKFLMLGLIAALALGSTWLNVGASRPSRRLEADDLPGAGVIVKTEVVDLWLPETLIDLVDHRPECVLARTQQELRTTLECRGVDDLWYAYTIRCYQVNGGVGDVTFVRRPSLCESQNFAEYLNVLATAAGNPPGRYASAEVHILPGNLSARQVREAVERRDDR